MSTDMTITQSLEFQHNYSVELADELPGNGRNTFWFKRTGARGSDGLLLRIRTGELNWTGVFARAGGQLTGYWSLPSPSHLLVCCKGAGYVVNASDPKDWKPAVFVHLTQALSSVPDNIVVVADFCYVAAYGPNGLRWKTDRLSLDGVRINGIDKGIVRVSAYTPQGDRWNAVAISASDGSPVFAGE